MDACKGRAARSPAGIHRVGQSGGHCTDVLFRSGNQHARGRHSNLVFRIHSRHARNNRDLPLRSALQRQMQLRRNDVHHLDFLRHPDLAIIKIKGAFAGLHTGQVECCMHIRLR